MEKYINFNTQKRNRAKNDFEKDFYKLRNNAVFGKMMKNGCNRLTLELFEKDDNKINFKPQWKLTFSGNHKSYESCDSYTFRQIEVLMDKPIYVGFNILEFSRLHMF